MMIKCDYVKCENCNVFDVCNLHQTTTSQLLMIRKELNWKINRLKEINKGINHFKTMLLQFKRNELSDFIMQHTSETQITKSLNLLRLEKKTLQSEIKEYQTMEKNIIKILKRGNNEF